MYLALYKALDEAVYEALYMARRPPAAQVLDVGFQPKKKQTSMIMVSITLK